MKLFESSNEICYSILTFSVHVSFELNSGYFIIFKKKVLLCLFGRHVYHGQRRCENSCVLGCFAVQETGYDG